MEPTPRKLFSLASDDLKFSYFCAEYQFIHYAFLVEPLLEEKVSVSLQEQHGWYVVTYNCNRV